MKLRTMIIENFQGIVDRTVIDLKPFTILVGRNDVGKSTVMKALDLFLNNTTPSYDLSSVYLESGIITMDVLFEPDEDSIIIDDNVTTTFEAEEMLDEQGLFHLRKVWDTTKSRVKADVYLIRKQYNDDDFLLLTEDRLIALCEKYGIETHKANGDEFNNVEKRAKLRKYYQEQEREYSYVECKLPTSGNSRLRNIHNAIKNALPRFEFFRADTSLSETDTAIQNYFRDIATSALQDYGLDEIEEAITNKLSDALHKITNKINKAVPQDEAIRPITRFDWTKVVRTTFATGDEETGVPLSLRGDGFRRITMMAYFEHLAEENTEYDKSIIFGFEEPETFLHPAAQEQLFEKLLEMVESGYQIIISSHSPIIVANSQRDSLIHVYKDNGRTRFNCDVDNIGEVARDLGISVDNQFVSLFDSAKVLLLVEGIDDAKAVNHVAAEYKKHGEIEKTLDELGIVAVPIGGCSSIKHWVALDLLQKLTKPFYVLLDSDAEGPDDESPNRLALLELGFREGENFSITRKRALENYIPCEKLNEFVPNAGLNYGDWDHVKKICKMHPLSGHLGGKNVVERHFFKLSYEDLKASLMSPDGDEFLDIYNRLVALLPEH